MVNKNDCRITVIWIHFSLIFGLALIIVFRKNVIIVVISVCCILLTGLPLLFIADNKLEQLHKTEINKVIVDRGGIINSIDLSDSKLSPFSEESDSGNKIYKITYSRSDLNYTAWYRGTKVINDIHAKPSKGYGEKWIFLE
ncbi:hypothetical protein D3C73_879510 [compost metagenome]